MQSKFKAALLFVIMASLIAVFIPACSAQKEVVVYTSVDQVFSEPVFKRFEEETGIKVKAVYDIEAQKTTGLVTRLVAEKGGNTADVFWSGECMQTSMLKEEGVLAAYASPETSGLPEAFVDKDNMFTAFGGRVRVLLVNTEMMNVSDAPTRMIDLVTYGNDLSNIAIAYPVFGTAATHSAALYALWGEEKASEYFKTLVNRGIVVVDGNGPARDMVAQGRIAMALTDTDDALSAVEDGLPVEVVYLDQGGDGSLVIPNTAALVNGGANAEEGKTLVDYLLSLETEAYLNEIGWFDLAPRADANSGAALDVMDVSWDDVYEASKVSADDMTEIFVR
jgi:iron(III) transport system substrate-binding protein